MKKTLKSRPNWRDAYRALRHEIDNGILKPGDDLPTLTNLAAKSGLSVHGSRRVLESLCKEGRAQSWQGKGFRVAIPQISLVIATKNPNFGLNVTKLGIEANSEFVSSKMINLREKNAERLKPHKGNKVLLTKMIRKVRGRPIGVSSDYFSTTHLDGIDKIIAKTNSISKALFVFGVNEYSRDFTEVFCRPPTQHESLLLEIPKSQFVFQTRGTNVDKHRNPIQVSCGVWRADCVNLKIENEKA